MCGYRERRLWRAGWALLGLFWLVLAPALAATADIARGLTWLQGQVQADGQLTTPSRLAMSAQAQCETAQTLLRLVGSSAQVGRIVGTLPSTGADISTETLACGQMLRQQQGQVAGSNLATRRIALGGYSAFEGMTLANPLDTGWAIAAIASSASASDKQGLHVWLQSVQQPDGAFRANVRSNLYTTAIVLRGLKHEVPKSTQAMQVAQKAIAYLLAQRSATGTWGSDTALTALAYEAVHP